MLIASYRIVLSIALCFAQTSLLADYLITDAVTSLYTKHCRNSSEVLLLKKGDTLLLLDPRQHSSGFYHARTRTATGWIFRSFVRRYRGDWPLATQDEIQVLHAATTTLDKKLMPATRADEKLIEHRGFITCMSTDYHVPVWVYEKISASLLQGKTMEREAKYARDPLYQALKQSAYAGSGYDHGHLAPAADFKRDSVLYSESFLMTNMSPQHGCLNQKGWCFLESNVRKWATDRPGSEFFIFSGSLFDDDPKDALCLPRGITIPVPDNFFKIIAERRQGKFIRGVAFIVENDDVDASSIDSRRTNIDEVERITGLNFFPEISTAEELSTERVAHAYVLEDLHECPKRNTPCDKVYNQRKLPKDRSKLQCPPTP